MSKQLRKYKVKIYIKSSIEDRQTDSQSQVQLHSTISGVENWISEGGSPWKIVEGIVGNFSKKIKGGGVQLHRGWRWVTFWKCIEEWEITTSLSLSLSLSIYLTIYLLPIFYLSEYLSTYLSICHKFNYLAPEKVALISDLYTWVYVTVHLYAKIKWHQCISS